MSISNIRTRPGAFGPMSESTSRHAVYLKMAMLEMERERRGKEHVSAAARVARTAKRIAQINEEVAKLGVLVGIEDPSEGALAAVRSGLLEAGVPVRPDRPRIFRF
jgi:hypothetical protein